MKTMVETKVEGLKGLKMVEALKVEKMKKDKRIRNEEQMKNFNHSTSQQFNL